MSTQKMRVSLEAVAVKMHVLRDQIIASRGATPAQLESLIVAMHTVQIQALRDQIDFGTKMENNNTKMENVVVKILAIQDQIVSGTPATAQQLDELGLNVRDVYA